MTPLLVGVTHDHEPPHCFLNAACRSAFAERIAPKITDNCTLIIEGAPTTKTYRRGMFLYWLMRHAAEDSLGNIPARPSLIWRDFRQHPLLLNKHKYWFTRSHDVVERMSINYPHWDDLSELLAHLKHGRIDIRFTSLPSPEEEEALIETAASFKRFDEDMLLAVPRPDRAGQVYIVTGFLHSISLHLKTGWPVDLLDTSWGREKTVLSCATVALLEQYT